MLLSAIESSVVSPTESLAPTLPTPTPGWSPSVTGSVSVIVVPSLTESGPIDASRPMSLASSFASTSAPVVSRTTMSGVRSSLIGMPMSSCALASYWSAMSPCVSTATMSAKSSETFSGASIGATVRSVDSQRPPPEQKPTPSRTIRSLVPFPTTS